MGSDLEKLARSTFSTEEEHRTKKNSPNLCENRAIKNRLQKFVQISRKFLVKVERFSGSDFFSILLKQKPSTERSVGFWRLD